MEGFCFWIAEYFNEWIGGLDVNDFYSLMKLIIIVQLKMKVPLVICDHFINFWPCLIKAYNLEGKLGACKIVRTENKCSKKQIET